MDGTRYVKMELAVMMGLVVLAAVACSSPGQMTVAPTGDVTQEAIEQTQAPTPAETMLSQTQPAESTPSEEPTAGEPVVLNTCDLLTPEDVQIALGEAPAGSYDSYSAACAYTASNGRRLIVTAYQGDVARARTIEGMKLALQYFGNPVAQQLFDQIEPQLETITLAQMAEAFSGVEAALGREVTPRPELGDASYLVWIEGRSAQLGVVRGDTVTSVVTMDVDRQTAEPALLALTEKIWERLPERFTPAP